MKTTIIFFILSLSLFGNRNSQKKFFRDYSTSTINWVNTKKWQLYYIRSKKAYTFAVDTLKHFKSISLNQDSMKSFMQQVSDIPTDRTPTWMGYYVASCELADGTLVKIEVSQYGRFFYDEKERRYHQLLENVQADWLAYLTAKWMQIQSTF